MTSLAVGIVSYKTPQLTASAAQSALRIAPDIQVVVVDNASGDHTVDLLHRLQDDRLRIVVNPTNLGFGAASNRAAAEATSDVFIFLNSDAELSAEAAAALADEVEQFGGRCMAGPRLVSPDGGVQRSAGLLPAPTDLIVRGLGLNRVAAAISAWPVVGRFVRRSRLAREYDSAVRATTSIATSMVSGACFAIGRQAFSELGGFDERFFMYFEDADLCRRAARAGMAVRYVPQAVVPHVGGASSTEDYHFSPRHASSMRQYLAKWYGPPGASIAVVLMFVRAIAFTVGAPRRARRAWQSFGATLGAGGAA